MRGVRRIFMVDGKPFYPLGGQSRNSSGYNAAESETAFRAIKLLHGNTLEIPAYWEAIEPEEGRFDFSSVDALLASARQHDTKLILVWFATWKNGTMDYAPAWVKTNPQRFKRVISPTGADLWVLSSHCQANLDGDRKAFAALCSHLQAVDSDEHTVIGIQIENEPGILGSDRDYGPEAEAEFAGPVPEVLVAAMKAAGKGQVYDLWQQAGGRESGTWPEMFGWAAGECLSAWSIARYIDALGQSGKAEHDIPMFINVWLRETGLGIAGETYPAGGAVSKVLDIYKWCAPHVDVIAPDIHILASRNYEAVCAIYSREDNPLFVPESPVGSANCRNLFRAIADYDAIGYHFFGVEYIVAEDGSVRPELQALADSYRCVAAAIPLLQKYQGTGRVHAVIQEEHLDFEVLHLDGYLGLIHFGEGPLPRVRKDWRHLYSRMLPGEQTDANRGRGLVVQTSEHEFYLVGANYRLFLRRELRPEHMRPSFIGDFIVNRLAHHLQVDEGHFDESGEFVVDRRRNGDEINYGLWVEPDTGVLRVRMCE